MSRPARAELDMQALAANFRIARSLAKRSRVMAVVKANAYGHGAVAVSRALESRADAFAVASIDEAMELRDSGIRTPILLLEGVFEPAELVTAAQLGLWVTVASETQLACIESARLPGPVRCWLKVDTGMHRLGVRCDSVGAVYASLRDSRNVQGDTVIYTHLASADDLDDKQTQAQIEQFDVHCSRYPAPLSASNSAGLLAWPRAHYDWVRPGYMLYGDSPLGRGHGSAALLKPVMTLTSNVIALRDIARGEAVGYGASWVAQRPSRIATVAIGYGDGYPRHAPSGTPVLVNGRRALLAGRVSMDMITVDVTDISSVHIGDKVVLWGKGLPVSDVAHYAGTIGYELVTRMPPRATRIVI